MEVAATDEVAFFKQRQLTVKERHQDRELSRQGVWVPELCLRGLWLGRIGFEAGSRVVVDYVGDKLVISLSPELPESVRKAG